MAEVNIEQKKRGRKPRGGKIIEINSINEISKKIMPNIILKLNCILNKNIKENKEELNKINNENNKLSDKIDKLKIILHNNNINNNSACFWCTREFDTHPIYIPKNIINNECIGYGCFCRKECAAGFLMNEKIDTSLRVERYQLLNYIYNNNNINIKPAPDPHYILDKYYGTLTMDEYHELISQEKTFIIINKPITNILPELFEDNDKFTIDYKRID
jgi:hypothetical protein